MINIISVVSLCVRIVYVYLSQVIEVNILSLYRTIINSHNIIILKTNVYSVNIDNFIISSFNFHVVI